MIKCGLFLGPKWMGHSIFKIGNLSLSVTSTRDMLWKERNDRDRWCLARIVRAHRQANLTEIAFIFTANTAQTDDNNKAVSFVII